MNSVSEGTSGSLLIQDGSQELQIVHTATAASLLLWLVLPLVTRVMLERIKLWLVLQRVFLVMKVSTRFPLILTLGLPDGVSLWCVFGSRVNVDLVLTHFGYFILPHTELLFIRNWFSFFAQASTPLKRVHLAALSAKAEDSRQHSLPHVLLATLGRTQGLALQTAQVQIFEITLCRESNVTVTHTVRQAQQ